MTLRGARGANFGWNTFEGNHDANCGSDRGTPTAAEHSGPIHEYPHDGNGHSGCSITGGVWVRDKQIRRRCTDATCTPTSVPATCAA